MLSFRPMNLKLDRSRERRRTERKPSPPCPHVWESHEEIDRLIENLKTAFVANRITSVKTSTTRETVETTEERKCCIVSSPSQSKGADVQFGVKGGGLRSTEMYKNFESVPITEEQNRQRVTDTTEQCKSQVDNKIFYQSQVVNVEHKLEKHIPEKTVGLTPPLSSPAEDNSGSSQSTVVSRRQHVSVRERAKLLQQKVEEDYINELVMSQEESANETAEGNEARAPRGEQTSRRAEEIPGAVRVLPPGGPPRRGSSVDSAGVSPLTVLRASPFSRRAESQPPPMYVPPALSPTRQHARGRGQFCGSYDAAAYVGRFSRQIYEKDASATTSATASAVQSCTTSACSTLDKAFLSSTPPLWPWRPQFHGGADDRDHRLTPVGTYDSEVDELTAHHYKRKPSRSAPAPAPDQTMTLQAKRARDGYEADTDDTLARRRGSSVKEMARWIQACMSYSSHLCTYVLNRPHTYQPTTPLFLQ